MNVLPKSKEKADLEKSKELAFIDYESRMDLPWRFASGLIAAPMIPLSALFVRKYPKYRTKAILGICGFFIAHGMFLTFYADSDMADRDFGRGMYRKDGYKTLNEVDEKLRS